MDGRIEARIAGLEAEIASLKAMVAGDANTETESGPPTSDRRGMVKLLAASAVGAVAGAAIFNAQPAAAADGGPALLGVANTSTIATVGRIHCQQRRRGGGLREPGRAAIRRQQCQRLVPRLRAGSDQQLRHRRHVVRRCGR